MSSSQAPNESYIGINNVENGLIGEESKDKENIIGEGSVINSSQCLQEYRTLSQPISPMVREVPTLSILYKSQPQVASTNKETLYPIDKVDGLIARSKEICKKINFVSNYQESKYFIKVYQEWTVNTMFLENLEQAINSKLYTNDEKEMNDAVSNLKTNISCLNQILENRVKKVRQEVDNSNIPLLKKKLEYFELPDSNIQDVKAWYYEPEIDLAGGEFIRQTIILLGQSQNEDDQVLDQLLKSCRWKLGYTEKK